MNEKNDKRLALLYWQLGNEYRELSLLYDPEPDSLGDTPTPPDALVEAVSNFIKANKAKHIGRLTDNEMEPLVSALKAAHKKAGDSNAT